MIIFKKRKKVLVAMSGGVDSSVAAFLLKKQDYEVVGGFMKNWSDSTFLKGENKCPWEKDQRDARIVASKLGIPFYTFNFEKEYREKVVDYMIEGYRKGITPNPDVMCNKEIKFNLFLEKAKELGFDYIATGHYARIKKRLFSNHFSLLAGKDKSKDQSYFLWALNQEQLKKALFPVGNLTKKQVRKIARKEGFITAEKKDSQGICFIGDMNLFDFLRSQIPEMEGDILTLDGKKVGTHKGVWFYTIGQRRNIGTIGGGKAYYVVRKDMKNNILYVSENDPNSELYKKNIFASDQNWIEKVKFPFSCQARIRYRQPLSDCVVYSDKDGVRAEFKNPQKAPAEGQSIVFYKKDVVLGGAVITYAK